MVKRRFSDYAGRVSPSRRILLALVVGACAALSLGGTAAAAEFQVAGPAALNGNDATCAPCRTIQAAVTRAARAPGRDAVVLAAGTYSESVTILDEDDVQIGGRGAATAINGRITVGLPARGRGGNALSYNGIARRVWLVALGVRSPDVAITAQNVDVELHNTSIQGAIRMTNATLGGERNAIATTGCGPTISFTGTVMFTDANGQRWMGNNWLERSMVTGAVPLQSTMVGGAGLVHSFATAYQQGCASASAITGAGAGVKVYAHDTVINTVGSPLAAVEGTTNANLELSSATIVGSFQRGVRVSRGAWAQIDATAIDGPPIALDSSLAGRYVTRWVMASGVGVTNGNDSIRETTYRAALKLSSDVGYPALDSPVVNGIRTNIGELQIFAPGVHTDVIGTARPQAAFIGGPAVYDIGAWERTPEPLPLNGLPVGPGWVGVGLIPAGGLGVDLDGIGFPLNPNVPTIGTLGSGPESQAAATVATGPILQISVPKQAKQGAVVKVRVKAPYQGRLTVRVYGAKGKLINVARARKINRGTRVIDVRLGPNARIGDARVTAVLTRPNRPVLRDVETMRVVTRAR